MAERSTTQRGFIIYDKFTDTYGNDVRVQESSSATRDAVWIFCNEAPGRAGSAHLNVEQAKRVRDALDAFISEHEGDVIS